MSLFTDEIDELNGDLVKFAWRVDGMLGMGNTKWINPRISLFTLLNEGCIHRCNCKLTLSW